MSVNNYGPPINPFYPYNRQPQYSGYPQQPGQYMPTQTPKKKHPIRNGMLTGGIIGAVLGAFGGTERVINASIQNTINSSAKEKLITGAFTLPIKDEIIQVEKTAEQGIKDFASKLNGFASMIKNDSIKIVKGEGENTLKLGEKLLTKEWTVLRGAGQVAVIGLLAGAAVGLIASFFQKDKK